MTDKEENKINQYIKPGAVVPVDMQTTALLVNALRAALAQPEPDYRDVVTNGDLWRIEFLPDHAASVVLVRANYEAQPEKTDMQIGLTYEEANPPEELARLEQAMIEAWKPIPKKEWVGLTDEERNDCLVEADPCECLATPEAEELMRTVEAKLKEKNHG
jgi:hypothetical protein